ncbi:abscission/NoCut checkpoint regulator isoform X2 [Chelonus insularis]|nr:abscission/NoCut checkpoint regulator isoform X2 [Chelonus insularis]
MACSTCQSKFSFFTREHGCPSCGFSYCNKCLKYKWQLSSEPMQKICGPCYNRLAANKMDNNYKSTNDQLLPSTSSIEKHHEILAPIDVEKKLESLDNPVRPPIVMYKQGRWDKFKSGLDPVDQALVDRLRKLKEEDKQYPPPTTDEIRRRLALLKDQDPDQAHTNIYKIDTRSDQEKTEDLIQEYLETLQLSPTKDSTESIEQRLNALKEIDPSKSSSNLNSSEYDEKNVTKKLIEKALAEAALEKKFNTEDEIENMEIEG